MKFDWTTNAPARCETEKLEPPRRKGAKESRALKPVSMEWADGWTPAFAGVEIVLGVLAPWRFKIFVSSSLRRKTGSIVQRLDGYRLSPVWSL